MSFGKQAQQLVPQLNCTAGQSISSYWTRISILAFAITLSVVVAPREGNASPTLQIDANGILTGAQNVNVDGTSYDVQFGYGTCLVVLGTCGSFTLQSSQLATDASQALLGQVFIDSALGSFDSHPEKVKGCFTTCAIETPYGIWDSAYVAFQFAENHFNEVQDGASNLPPYQNFAYPSQPQEWAKWSLSALAGSSPTNPVPPVPGLMPAPPTGPTCGPGMKPTFCGMILRPPPKHTYPVSAGYVHTFTFASPTSGLWYDPPLADGFQYLLTGGEFTDVTTPSGPGFAFGAVDLYIGDILTATLNPGDTYTFGPGIDDFSFVGINPFLDIADPGFGTAYPVLLNFMGTPDNLTILPLVRVEETSVPEPMTLALFGGGFLGLVAMRRNRKKLAVEDIDRGAPSGAASCNLLVASNEL